MTKPQMIRKFLLLLDRAMHEMVENQYNGFLRDYENMHFILDLLLEYFNFDFIPEMQDDTYRKWALVSSYYNCLIVVTLEEERQ